MGLTAIIPTRNRASRLGAVLTPLLADRAVTEVIVVDDGSTDGTQAVLREVAARDGRLRVLRGAGAGKGAACEQALAVATGDVVLLLDDDVVPEPGLAAGHLEHHRRRRGLVVVGYMPVVRRPRTGGHGPSLVYSQDYERVCAAAEQDPSRLLLNLWGGNISLRRADALRVGLTSPAFSSHWRHIDRELGLRCHEAGLQGIFDRALLATHHHERTLGAYVSEARWQALGRVQLHRLHAATLGDHRLEDYLSDLTRPRAAVVRIASTRFGHRPTIMLLRAGCVLLGRLGLVDQEIVLTRLLRRAEMAFHARRRLSDPDAEPGVGGDG